MPGGIVIINGTSSSGKTSIIRCLQARLKFASCDLEIDTALRSVERCADRIIQHRKSPPAALKRLNPR